MALHRIIDMAKESWNDGDECVEEMIEELPASSREYDHDWVLVSDGCFQDHDVLMLYTMPQVRNAGACKAAVFVSTMTSARTGCSLQKLHARKPSPSRSKECLGMYLLTHPSRAGQPCSRG
jgi:hypothetical protein